MLKSLKTSVLGFLKTAPETISVSSGRRVLGSRFMHTPSSPQKEALGTFKQGLSTPQMFSVQSFSVWHPETQALLYTPVYPHRSVQTLRSSSEGLLAVPSLREAKLQGTDRGLSR
ncbi:Hypothetical predicted protein [Podarcis lilfordi]|uniref:Uncharacterized protein n=1 Tax=Podarcis lilfordi TaxID=74358 RepID=A0AA35LDB3_9SAUR|nr:Hypothetical predicted protein [Podarcis lilfordi]